MKIKCQINKALLPGKMGFFWMMSATLWTHPFMVLIFKQMGLSTTECAVIYGALPIFNGFYKLFIGAVADKFQRHREMMLTFALVSAVLMSCLVLIPPVEEIYPPEPEWNKTLHYECIKYTKDNNNNRLVDCEVRNASNLHPSIDKSGVGEQEWYQLKNEEFRRFSDCAKIWNDNFHILDGCLDTNTELNVILNNTEKFNSHLGSYICQLDCTNYPSELLNPPPPTKEMYGKTFWMAFCLYFAAFNIYASNWVLLYGMNYAVLGEKRNNFGRQRLWGTYGAIITAVVTAVSMNKYGSKSVEINYTPCFVGFAIAMVISGASAIFFKLPPIPRNPTMAKHMFQLLKQPKIFLLFTVLFIMGFLWGAVDTFLFVFLRELNASSWTLGACLFVTYLSEIPSLYYSGRIIKRIGHVKCLYIVLCVYTVRYLGTSLIPNPWWELPFSALKSIAFAIGFTAASVYTSLITPPSMHATLQAMVQTVHFGVGRGIGILAFGPTMDAIGARWSFRICSLIALVTLILYAIIDRFLPKVKFVTGDEVKEDATEDAKEPMKTEHGELKKPLFEDNDEKAKEAANETVPPLSENDPWLPRRADSQDETKTREETNGLILNGNV